MVCEVPVHEVADIGYASASQYCALSACGKLPLSVPSQVQVATPPLGVRHGEYLFGPAMAWNWTNFAEAVTLAVNVTVCGARLATRVWLMAMLVIRPVVALP